MFTAITTITTWRTLYCKVDEVEYVLSAFPQYIYVFCVR